MISGGSAVLYSWLGHMSRPVSPLIAIRFASAALVALLLAPAWAGAQREATSGSAEMVALPPRWPTEIVRYDIDARLDVERRQVLGRETITWRNTSTQAVPDLWFHLYQNAYKSPETTFLRGAPEYVDELDGKWGWVEVSSLRVGSNGDRGEDLAKALEFVRPDDGNENDFTVARVSLPSPVPPGGSVQIQVEFVTQLTPAIDRTGYHGSFYFVAQWFPKLGVFEDRGVRGRAEPGWNCHQYHASSEYYADFGTYDVRVSVPKGYVFGSTGVVREVTETDAGLMTFRAVQEHVHDFAWTADPAALALERDFLWRDHVTDDELARAATVAGVATDEAALRDVKVRLLLRPEHGSQAERHFKAIFVSLEHYGLRYGAYPYEQLTVVDPSYGARAVGGMEYPTFLTAGTELLAPKDRHDPESVIVHEIGHQWWQGMVATNEFEESWLDEGINSYCEGSILAEAYGPNHRYERVLGVPVSGRALFGVALPSFPFYGVGEVPIGPLGRPLELAQWMGARRSYLAAPEADPMLRPSWGYRDRQSYGINSYSKPEAMLTCLERYLGRDRLTRALRAFQLRWRFRHPTTADFAATVSEIAGEDLDPFFEQLVHGSGVLDYAVGRVEGGDGKPVRVVVERRGDVVVPVEVRVRFTDGSESTLAWDGRDRWTELVLTGRGEVAGVDVDPRGVWAALDADLLNNGVRLTGWRLEGERWSADTLFWLQSLFYELSLLS